MTKANLLVTANLAALETEVDAEPQETRKQAEKQKQVDEGHQRRSQLMEKRKQSKLRLQNGAVAGDQRLELDAPVLGR